jgi:hypothetical protein
VINQDGFSLEINEMFSAKEGQLSLSMTWFPLMKWTSIIWTLQTEIFAPGCRIAINYEPSHRW